MTKINNVQGLNTPDLLFNNRILEDTLLTMDELAEILKVSKKTIYGWIYRNKIIPQRIGGLLRFHTEYIKEWISTNQGGS